MTNNVMENSLVIITNLNQMVSDGKGLMFLDLGLCSSDSMTFGLIIVLTLFQEYIRLRFFGDDIDFALLQFAAFALLSIANQNVPKPHKFSCALALPVISLAANVLLPSHSWPSSRSSAFTIGSQASAMWALSHAESIGMLS